MVAFFQWFLQLDVQYVTMVWSLTIMFSLIARWLLTFGVWFVCGLILTCLRFLLGSIGPNGSTIGELQKRIKIEFMPLRWPWYGVYGGIVIALLFLLIVWGKVIFLIQSVCFLFLGLKVEVVMYIVGTLGLWSLCNFSSSFLLERLFLLNSSF